LLKEALKSELVFDPAIKCTVNVRSVRVFPPFEDEKAARVRAVVFDSHVVSALPSTSDLTDDTKRDAH
jgi:hypothetical protein